MNFIKINVKFNTNNYPGLKVHIKYNFSKKGSHYEENSR